MRLSIAMCSFNGAAFIREQLASIAAQSRRPDELVICDDASTDNTVALIQEFSAAANFPVKLILQSENISTTRNFDCAIAACQGEVIALSDHDDVWLPGKLAALERAFQEHPDAGLVLSDAQLVDECLQPLQRTLWRTLDHTGRLFQQLATPEATDILLRQNLLTGATLAFRADFRPMVQPIPPGWVHDAWIGLIISAIAPLVPLSQCLIQYRQHPAQQIGARQLDWRKQLEIARQMDLDYFRQQDEAWEAALERLSGLFAHLRDPGLLQHAIAKLQHCRNRLQMRRNGWRLPLILRELIQLRYMRYSYGWRSIGQDLLL